MQGAGTVTGAAPGSAWGPGRCLWAPATETSCKGQKHSQSPEQLVPENLYEALKELKDWLGCERES